MQKKQSINEVAGVNNLRLYLDYLMKNKKTFRLEYSNYWSKIEYNGRIFKFIENPMSFKTFVASKLIARDIENSNIVIDFCDRDFIKYFSHELKADEKNVIYNVDIKSAYATVLLNEHLISDKTYKYICNLPKQERLAAVGMIAGKKNIIEYFDGKAILTTSNENKLSNYFFYCVYRTHEIISDLQKILPGMFLFSWVDGLYFTSNNIPELNNIREYFENIKMNFTFERLVNYKCKEMAKYFYIEFDKGDEKKIFYLPKKPEFLASQFLNYYLSKNKI